MGLAVGDALGTTIEFKAPGTFTPVANITGGGPFNLPKGAWTDETSMALCLAESLVERAGFDPVDQLQRYLRWYRDGYLSSTGAFFDIGGATAAALHRFERTGEPYPGDASPDAGGNAPLMRLAPIPLAYATHPATAIELAAASARTTHGHPAAIDATRYLAALTLAALRGIGREEALAGEGPAAVLGLLDGLHPEVRTVAEGSFRQKQPPSIRGGGYAVHALEAALWALHTTDSFEEGALAAVNLGDDADTTGAIYGQLAGAVYGIDAIPADWREVIAMGDEILALADALYELAHTIEPPAPPLASAPAEDEVPVPELPQNTYWVEDGRILAGPYPGAQTKNDAEARLRALLELRGDDVRRPHRGTRPPHAPRAVLAPAEADRHRDGRRHHAPPSADRRHGRAASVAHARHPRRHPHRSRRRRDGLRALLGRSRSHRDRRRMLAARTRLAGRDGARGDRGSARHDPQGEAPARTRERPATGLRDRLGGVSRTRPTRPLPDLYSPPPRIRAPSAACVTVLQQPQRLRTVANDGASCLPHAHTS
jgi:ADP-ribosyl-[dinitrogen reductase] hydrolase